MLEDYAMKHGFTNLVHFTDDGWSGATFDRPSWNRLVEGVKNGEITACICKDMSRIGRDHLQVGFFTDILFREKEVRFIAINNGIDSDRQETSEFAPFLNIMNEWFVRDTSKKIKAVLKSRGSSGNAHTSNIPPYGYLKDPENPDHWIIDEEAAEVVRRIYRMTIEGKGPYQIARELSEEKIERPSYYLGKKGLGNHASNYDKENPYMWRGNQVTTLIARPEYIGKTVNFRTFKNSYKDKKTKRADKEDWVVFDDTQEPIVDEETWLLAQKLRQNVRKADPMGEPNVLTGKIYCADCGAPMYNHRQRKGRERIYYTAKGEKRTSHSNPADCYECSTYNLGCQRYGLKVGRTGMACCPFHSDKSPSMKLDERYYCFGCGATGDAVDLTAKLFGIGLREAAVKLAEDFGLNYDSRQKPSVRPRIREPTPEQKYQKEENHCYKVLTDYFHLLREWEKKYAPKQPDEEWSPLFAEALYKKNYIEYLLDILLYGSLEERKALVAEQRKEALKHEQRIAELSADRTMHSRRNPKQLRAERER